MHMSDWELVASMGEWAGAITVIATLFYLARQVSSGVQIAKAQTERELKESLNNFVKESWQTLESTELFSRGTTQGFQNLNAQERLMFGGRLSNLLNLHDTFLRMHNQRLADDSMMRQIDYMVASTLLSPGGEQWWELSKQFFIGNKEYVDQLLDGKQAAVAWSDWQRTYTS
jgi:hypothetical protein